MNGVGLGFNPAAFARSASTPTQGQMNQQAATGGRAAAFSGDSIEKKEKAKEFNKKFVNPKIATKKLVAKAKKVGGKANAG